MGLMTSSCGGTTGRRRDELPWAPLLAVSLCLLAYTVANFSLLTYMGVYVQELLGLPSLDVAGEGYYILLYWCVHRFLSPHLYSSVYI